MGSPVWGTAAPFAASWGWVCWPEARTQRRSVGACGTFARARRLRTRRPNLCRCENASWVGPRPQIRFCPGCIITGTIPNSPDQGSSQGPPLARRLVRAWLCAYTSACAPRRRTHRGLRYWSEVCRLEAGGRQGVEPQVVCIGWHCLTCLTLLVQYDLVCFLQQFLSNTANLICSIIHHF